MTQTINPEAVVDFVQKSGAALDAADSLLTEHRKTETKLASQAPILAKKLVGLGVFDGVSEKTAAEALKDPLKVQSVLGQVLDYIDSARTAKQASDLGAGVPAAAQSQPNASPYDKPMRAGDAEFLRDLGISA